MAMSRQKRDKRKRVSGRKRAEEHKSGFEGSSVKLPEGVGFFSVKKAGVHRIEIIPYRVPEGAGNPYADDGDYHFERTFFIHRGIGPNNETRVCPRKTAGRPCPICEYRSQLTKEEDPDEDLIKDLAPKERQLWNVFDHSNSDEGVQIWDVSFYLFGKALDARVKNADEDDDYEFFADPEDGLTLKIGFEEKSFGGRTFYDTETIDFKARRKALDPELFEKAVVLDEALVIEEYEVLKALFLQTEAPSSDDDEPKKKEKPKRSSSQKKKPKEEKEHFPTAEEFGLEKGDMVKYKDEVCEIVKISGDGTSLTLMDSDDEIVRAVGPEDVKKLKEDEKPRSAEDEAKTPPDDDDDDDDGWPDDDDDD